MTKSCVAIAAALVLSGTGGSDLSGQAADAPQARPSYTSATSAILVDVVVRDRNGRPVLDLSAADFEVTEDGVAQKVDTFARVSRGGGIGVGVAWKTPGTTVAVRRPSETNPSAGDTPDASLEETTTALVFDHLSSESLRLAQRATLAYVPMTGESSVRVGVFATDPGIRVMQGYTTDRTLVRRAVEQILPSGTSAEDQKADRTDDLMGRRRELRGQTEASAAGGVAGTSPALARNASAIGERDDGASPDPDRAEHDSVVREPRSRRTRDTTPRWRCCR